MEEEANIDALRGELARSRQEQEQRRLAVENARLKRALSNAGIMPESEVELAKDLFTPEINAGKYGSYIAKNLGLGNYTPQEARIILIYQSLIDTAVNENLNRGHVDLAGFFESKKMSFALTATAAKEGFLLQNLRTSRGISEIMNQDLRRNNQGIASKMMPQSPDGVF